MGGEVVTQARAPGAEAAIAVASRVREVELRPLKIRATAAAAAASMFVFIVASYSATAVAAPPEDPPENWIHRVAARETETEAARSHYTYRQIATVEDFDPKGLKTGLYKEIREVVFSPTGERTEQLVGKPVMRLDRIKLTAEDFRDLREVQPALIAKETLFLYDRQYRGEDTVDGIDCWMLEIRPKQILAGERLFDGTLWIDKRDFSTIRTSGQAVPQIRTLKDENLFPRFTTVRSKIDGDHWFPAKTLGDDVLQFRTGPQRIRLTVDYSNYQRFGAESKITFGDAKP
ncbi:MAG TPA: hypothetical protein VGL53_19060 [Bryobacteraceae bacterium]